MPSRHDISGVPLQGGYVAKQCPVRAQNDVVVPGEPLPPTPFMERQFKGGNDFEAEIFATLSELHADAVVIEGHAEEAEAATTEAMRRGLPLIIGGRLPADHAGRRVGKPDILVAAAGGGYRAVDVKHHMSVAAEPPGRAGIPALLSPLMTPSREAAVTDDTSSARKHEDDVLQLAHYQRMLEAVGMAASDGHWGGIIGTERQVVWFDLDAPLWRTPSVTQKTRMRTTMERYDFEFDFRLDIIAVARQHLTDPSVALLTVPVKISECERCPWWGYCRPLLEVPPGDVSLLPRVGWTQWKAHRDHGVTNRAELAALDPLTARLVADGLNVPALMTAAAAATPQTSLATLTTAKAADLLAIEGLTTADDVSRLDPQTAAYSDIGLSALPAQIDLARAALGSEPAYRKRGLGAITVPRADVEVDVDMENVETGCYLWGCLVTDRSDHAIVEDGYQAFHTWESMTPEVEAANSLRFWRRLMDVRATTLAAGLTFRAYCWNAGAENQYLRRLGQIAGIEDEVAAFIASDEWVDVLKQWDEQLITGGPSGLKVVASLLGFTWNVDDPGGGESMIKYDRAVAGDTDARDWLLTYNRGDVDATLAVREWMDATAVPAIEDVVPARAATPPPPPHSYGSRDVQPGYESQGYSPRSEPWGKDPWTDAD